MDKIIIKNLEIFSYVGVNKEEKILGQKFLIDLFMYVDIKNSGENDNLDSTISYSNVIKFLTKFLSEKTYDLLEKTASVLAKELFLKYEMLNGLKLCLKKPMAPMKAHFDYVAVEIERFRSDFFNWKLF